MPLRPKPALRAFSALATLILVAFLFLPSAHAFDARGAERITIGPDEVIDDDLYLAGQYITIDGTVHGDVFAAGQIVTLNGTVDGSFAAAGQTVIINGTVEHTARVAAQAIQLGSSARVGRDLMSAGYSLEGQSGSVVGQDLAYGGYQALLAGEIGRNVRADMGALALRGTVGGDMTVSVGSPAEGAAPPMTSPPPGLAVPVVQPGLAIADSARVGGHLTYTSEREFPIAGQVGQGVTHTTPAVEPTTAPSFASILADNIRRLVAIGVVGLLLLWLVPRATAQLVDTIEGKPLPSLGWGVVAAIVATAVVIGIAIAIIILAIGFGVVTLWNLTGLVVVLGLLGEAVFVTGLTIYAWVVAQALISYLVGRLILRQTGAARAAHWVVPLLIGVPIFVFFTAFPILGPVIGVLAALAALGSLWIRVRDRNRSATQASPTLPADSAAVA
jgi:cytoskeletal protein CcmA (bactofilin family)